MFKTKKSAIALTILLALAGCASTGESDDADSKEGGMFSNLSDMLAGKGEGRPAWADEPLVTLPMCNTFTMDNVKSFVATYMAGEDDKSGDSVEEAGKKAMETYTLAAVLVNRSQLCMAEALELKEVTELLQKEKAILLSGTSLSKSEVEKHREYSAEASNEIIKYTKEINAVKPEQRETFVFGISAYLAGSYTTVEVKNDVADYAKQTGDAVSDSTKRAKNSSNTWTGWLSAASEVFDRSSSGGATLYNIGSGLIDHLKNMRATGTYLIKYSQRQNLKLPADATEQFFSIASWGDDEETKKDK